MLESGEIWKPHDQIIRFHKKLERSPNIMPSGNAVMPEPVEISHATPEIVFEVFKNEQLLRQTKVTKSV